MAILHTFAVTRPFQKKSKSGIATPKAEIDLVAERIKRLKEELKP